MHHSAAGLTRTRRTVALAVVLLLAMPLLAGCLRARMTMGISGADRVTGELIIATQGGAQAPPLKAPRSIADRVSVRPYDQDGYSGSDVFFSDLTFAQLQDLTALTDVGASQYKLALRRAGSTVTLEGSANLTTLAADGADVQLSVNFPGNITATNGIRDGASGVRWEFPAGETSMIQATAAYDDPGTRGDQMWILAVSLAGLAAAALVGTMAYVVHARPRWARRKPR